MSSAINVYAVSIERLRSAMGSGDQSLIDVVINEQADFLSSIDAIDEDTEISCADAVEELIRGEISEDAPGYIFGYALEAICSHIGEELPNICQIAGSGQWIEEVDEELNRKGIPIGLTELLYSGSPVPILEPDDYPFIGQWGLEAIAAAKIAFANADLSDCDEEMIQTLHHIRGWVDAVQDLDTSIVGFLS